MHNGCLFTCVQFLTSDASANPSFDQLVLDPSKNKADISLQSLPSLFHFSSHVLANSPAHLFCLSSSNFLILVSLFSTQLCNCVFSFSLRLLWATSVISLLSSLNLFSLFIIEICGALPGLEMERASYSSRSALILLLVQYVNTPSFPEWFFDLDMWSMCSHSVLDIFLVSRFMTQSRFWIVRTAMSSLHWYENGSFQMANPRMTCSSTVTYLKANYWQSSQVLGAFILQTARRGRFPVHYKPCQRSFTKRAPYFTLIDIVLPVWMPFTIVYWVLQFLAPYKNSFGTILHSILTFLIQIHENSRDFGTLSQFAANYIAYCLPLTTVYVNYLSVHEQSFRAIPHQAVPNVYQYIFGNLKFFSTHH